MCDIWHLAPLPLNDMNARLFALAAVAVAAGTFAPTSVAQLQQVAPDVKNLKITPVAFKPLAEGGPVIVKGGALVAFDLRDGAQVTFTFRSVKYGKKVGGTCKPGTARTKKKRCEILTTVPGSMLYVAFSGHNEFRFSGRPDSRPLKVGTYRLVGKAAGTAARSSSTLFKIIK